jgi:glycosyltransferase involved in cell wall biosynthesis
MSVAIKAPLRRPLPPRSASAAGPWDGLVVLCAANNWDEVKLADRHMAEHLAEHHAPVLYVDPPISHLTRFNAPLVAPSLKRPRLRQIAPRIARYTPLVPPKPMEPAMLPLTNRIARRQLRSVVQRLGAQAEAVISTWLFVDAYGVCGERVRAYWWRDDPVAAAPLWRRPAERLAAGDRRLTETSDLVVSVSEGVASELRTQGVEAAYLPNGCDARFYEGVDRAADPADVDLPTPVAGFIGHLNSRTDLALLEAVVAAGASLLLVGPRDPAFEPARFEALLAQPHVTYVGPQRFEQLLPYLKTVDVGIVPYANTQFNRNSFPLKTLEYLAAGKPVVSTPLPAVRSLRTDLVTLAESPGEFAAAVMREAARPREPALVAARREFAAEHSWTARADRLAGLLGLGTSSNGRGADGRHG